MIKNVQMIEVDDWDDLVQEVYGKPYSFQQQDGCKDRGLYYLSVPSEGGYGFDNDTVPEEINGNEMGVSFEAWKARDVSEWNGAKEDTLFINLFWERNFYPEIEDIANDLHAKGKLPAGDYIINIDW